MTNSHTYSAPQAIYLDLNRPPKVGDIYRIVPYPSDSRSFSNRLGLIISTADSDIVEILLIHTEIAKTGAFDLLFETHETGMEYAVVVQTDVRGIAWVLSLDERIGSLHNQFLKEVQKVSGLTSGDIETIRNGAPILSNRDRRWHFKLSELEGLQNLTADCNERYFAVRPRLDWALFSPNVLANYTDIDTQICSLTQILRTSWNRTLFTLEDLDQLFEHGALDIQKWRALHPSGELIHQMLLSQMEKSFTRSDQSEIESDATAVRQPTRRDGAGSLECLDEDLLITSPELWNDFASLPQQLERVTVCAI